MFQNRIAIFLFLLYIASPHIFAQTRYDENWRLGQSADIGMRFIDGVLNVDSLMKVDSFVFGGTNMSISNSEGVFQFYANGCDLYNANNTPIINGEMISPGVVEDFFCSSIHWNPVSQGGLVLPVPGTSDEYYVLNYDLQVVEYFDTLTAWDPQNLLMHRVKMNSNDGLGVVVSKNEIVVHDDLALARGQLQAVKHANGNDWWVVVPKAVSNCYHLILLGKNGVELEKTVCIGEPWSTFHATGQAVFSKDGARYIRVNPWHGINIFDFDRCEGVFYNPIVFPFSETGFQAAGAAISSNDRFLYVTRLDKIFQFDLNAENIEQSKVLIDTLGSNLPSFSAAMYLCQIGPDDKIYIAGTGSHAFLHVIDSPNEKGLDCNFRLNGVALPDLNFGGIPNFPNYDLGASDSDCEPVSTSTFQEGFFNKKLSIFPNPSSDLISIGFEGEEIISYELYTVQGKRVLEDSFSPNLQSIHVAEWPNGIYILKVTLGNGLQASGKFIKQ